MSGVKAMICRIWNVEWDDFIEKASEKSGAFYAEGNYTVSSEMRRFFKSVLKKTQKITENLLWK